MSRLITVKLLLLLCLFHILPTSHAKGFTFNHKGLHFHSSSNNFKARLGGRLHLDSGTFIQGEQFEKNSSALRRARLALRVSLYDYWRLSIQHNSFDDKKRYSEAWVSYRGFNSISIKAGQFTEPFGLEALTSSNVITFMERSLPTVLSPGTNVGASLAIKNTTWTATSGFFWETYIEDEKPFDSSEGQGLTGRLTLTPIKHKRTLLHLGTSVSLRWPGERKRIRFATRPETRITRERLVNTGRIKHVDRYIMTNMEAAVIHQSFSMQTEYMHTRIMHEGDTGSDETIYGAYIAASWFLTGEQRNYKHGIFTRTTPKKNTAWEMAIRYSLLNLNGKRLNGGKEHDTTFAINLYYKKNTRFMFNYIRINADTRKNNIDAQLLQMRWQLML